METKDIMPTESEPIKIVCGDCLEVMKSIPDNSINPFSSITKFNGGLK